MYAGTDPLTGREIRFRQTCKTKVAAQIELGKLLERALAGRQPETGSTVARLPPSCKWAALLPYERHCAIRSRHNHQSGCQRPSC